MDKDVIDAVKAMGFKVYMRKPTDTWFYYTLGARIGTVSGSLRDGYVVTTVHIPNKQSGTGYRICEVHTLSVAALMCGFARAPEHSSYTGSVVKFRDFEHFKKYNSWNGAYVEV